MKELKIEALIMPHKRATVKCLYQVSYNRKPKISGQLTHSLLSNVPQIGKFKDCSLSGRHYKIANEEGRCLIYVLRAIATSYGTFFYSGFLYSTGIVSGYNTRSIIEYYDRNLFLQRLR